jgi:polysaccharide biosynthesis protein PslH
VSSLRSQTIKSQPRLLFVSPRFPYPLIQGDRLRAYELLRRLASHYQITLLAPDTPDAAHITTQLGINWWPVHIGRFQPVRALPRALLTGEPFQVAYLCPPAFLAAARTALAQGNYDLIHLHTARVGPIATLTSLPVVADLMDALSLNMQRRANYEPRSRRWFFLLEARRMLLYEQNLLARSAAAMVVSSTDYTVLGKHPKLHVVSSGVDLERFRYNDQNRDQATIVFSGRMAYFPNADAARFLVHEVLPYVRQQVPQVQLEIVGADPPANVQELAKQAGVTVRGYVPDLAHVLQHATVAVAPIRTGTGIQTKVMEAMACGTPVVATPQALAGIEAQADLHALCAEDAPAFAAKLVQLLQDATLRQQLAQAARTWLEVRYTWEATANAVDRLYQRALTSTNLF